MAFATTEDVQNRLGRALTTAEQQSVEFLLAAAAAVIAAAASKEEAAISPGPPVLRFVSVEVVVRALANPSGLASFNESLGNYQYAARFRDAGVFLTDVEERLVRRAVLGRTSGSARVQSVIDDIYGS